MTEIENLTQEQWLSCLRPYQREVIKDLIELHGEDCSIDLWLSFSSTDRIALFGGESKSDFKNNKICSAFKKEMRKFICGHKDYEQERLRLKAIMSPIGLSAATEIAIVLSSVLGISVVMLLPAVILSLQLAGKMGLNTFCNIND